MNIILSAMSTLSDRVREAVDAAKNRGHSIADIATRCGISVQAVYQWIDPLNSLKEIKASSLLGLADLSGLNPWYINEGKVEMTAYNTDNKIKAVALAMQSMPEYKKDVLVQTSAALAEPATQVEHKNNGTQ